MVRFITLIVLALALAGMAVADLSSMPKTVNGGNPVEISIQHLPSATGAYDITGKALVAVAQAFMERYPNVILRPFDSLRPPQGSEGTGEAGIQMAMAAGVGPTVLVVNFRQSETFISQGFLRPLDDFMAEWENSPGGTEELRRIIPSEEVWSVIRRVGPGGKEHVWTVPPILFLGAFFYRKDVLRNAGYGPDDYPKNWDELYRMALKITDPRPGKGLCAYRAMNSYGLTPLIWSAGSEVLKRDPKTGGWYAAYANKEAVQACIFYWKLINQPWGICPKDEDHFDVDVKSKKGTCAHGHTYTIQELKKVKMFFNGFCAGATDYAAWSEGKQAFSTGYLGDLRMNLYGSDPNLTGVAPMPLGPTGLRGNELNSSMLGINGTIHDPAKEEAAWAYIRFAASEGAKRIQTKVLVEGGFARNVNPVWLRQFGYKEYLRETPPGWEETYKTCLASAHPEPYGKNAQLIYNEMDLAWDKIKLLPDPDPKKIMAILQENVVRTNERLMGTVSPAEKRKRDVTALVVTLGIVALFALMIKFTLATYGTTLSSEKRPSMLDKRRQTIAWFILLPALAGVLLFQYVPLARGSTIAFQDYVLFGAKPFIGVSNFGAALFAPEFWNALLASFKYAALALGLGFFTPVILALLLHEVPRGSLFFRIVYYLPAVTSGIVIMLLWKQLYDPTPYGILNQILAIFHIETQTFLQDPNLALFCVILPGIWAGVGPGCIIYLAALKQIPEDYYEAADVDGAGFWSKFVHITFPFLKPLLIISFVGACVGAFKAFEPVWIMTGGGPAGATNVVGLEIWRNSFMYLKYGYATAMGWLLASLLIGFTIFQLQYLSKVQFRLAKSD
ncbi:MAG: extracellular solute-binding protein [Armatimonadota bacterium]